MCAKGQGPRRILEVGPGTGAVTARLVEVLQPDDHLTLVELNDEFVEHLKGRFATEPSFQAVANRSELVHCRLEELPGDGCYDRIISGLPLNNFAAADVEQILDVFGRLLKAGGVLSFFEYIAIRRVKQVVSGRAERQRLAGDRPIAGRPVRTRPNPLRRGLAERHAGLGASCAVRGSGGQRCPSLTLRVS